MALGHLGVQVEVGNVDTENSPQAAACRRFYDNALKKILRDARWPFGTKIKALALVEEQPNDEWALSYRYPSDCLDFRKIQSGVRNDTEQTRVKFKIAQDDSGLLVFTDKDLAIAEYTILVEDTTRWPPDFTMAFTYLLAFLAAPSITRGDQFKLGQTAGQMYKMEIANAKANAANEEGDDVQPESEFISTRE